MPSRSHEAFVELVREEPAVVADLLRDLCSVSVPTFASARLESADLSQLQPTEFRADAVVALVNARGDPLAAIVVEVQLSIDADKRFVWPVYLTTLRARMRCSTWLLVIASDRTTARWCAKPIPIGHREWVLRPLVIGPSVIPRIVEADKAAEQPWLAVLSALAHHHDPERDAVFRALLEGTKSLDDDQISLYIDTVLAGLPEVARQHLEALMATGNYTYKSDFARRYYGQGLAAGEERGEARGEARGETRGEANALLTLLAARHMRVPAALREQILGCTDSAQITEWIQRAATAPRLEDVFS